jgi:hypothetical protein
MQIHKDCLERLIEYNPVCKSCNGNLDKDAPLLRRLINVCDALFMQKIAQVVDEPEEFWLKLMRYRGEALRHFKYPQTEKICLIAVRQNGLAVQYVENQTPEICMEAVKENPMALQYIRNQTREICEEAILKAPYALGYVRNQSYDMCKLAVSRHALAIEHIRDKKMARSPGILHAWLGNKNIMPWLLEKYL